jgi:hypothetical protein
VPPPIKYKSSNLHPKIELDLTRSLEIGQNFNDYQIDKKDTIKESIKLGKRLLDGLSDISEPAAKIQRNTIQRYSKMPKQTMLYEKPHNTTKIDMSDVIRKISSETFHTD